MTNHIIILLIIILLSIGLYFSCNKKEKYNNLNPYNIPKNIFTFWHTSKLDPLIEYHIEIWKKKLPDWTIHVLTMDNINDYVDNKYYMQFDNLIAQHFADHIRLYLLEKYGGLWMDGSILIKNPSFIYDLYNDMYNRKTELGVFEYKVKTVNDKYPYLENWFIMAPLNSRIIKLWKTEFDKCKNTDESINQCRQMIIKSGINIDETIKNTNYLMQHAILNMLCYKKKINLNNISILQATESMFFIQDKAKWDVEEIGKIILSDEINKYDNIYAMKYTGATRRYLSERIDKYKLINK